MYSFSVFYQNTTVEDYHALKKKISDDGDSGIEMLRRLAGKATKYPDKRNDVLMQVKRIESVASKIRVKFDA
jgi:hypothetical protein